MVAIFGLSTNLGSSNNTGHFIRPLIHWFFPHIAPETFDTIHFCIRKMGHLSEYGILAVLIWRLLRGEPRFAGSGIRREFARVILLCALYAASDEFHQSFSSEREAQVKDVAIDTCGALCGALAFLGVARWRQRK